MKPERKNRLHAIALLRAIVLFLVVVAVSVTVVEYVLRTQTADKLDAMSQSAYRILDLQHEIIHSQLGAISSDLLFLANQNELASYVETNDRSYLDTIAQEYLELSRHKAIYDQIRLLDGYGMELVRINFNDGNPIIVAQELLQPKGARYYFTQTIALQSGKVFVSPFDLNMEHGVVEIPRKPAIRFVIWLERIAAFSSSTTWARTYSKPLAKLPKKPSNARS